MNMGKSFHPIVGGEQHIRNLLFVAVKHAHKDINIGILRIHSGSALSYFLITRHCTPHLSVPLYSIEGITYDVSFPGII